MPLPPDFDRARAELLEAMVAEHNLPLFKLVQEYQRNPEFKRRVDIAALSRTQPESETVH
jgi:hypothetical protein